MIDQVPFGTNDFAENPEPRCPCVLLLDVSGSMGGEPIDELNAGLATYREAVASDSLASKRVEVAIVTFGGRVDTVQSFTSASTFYPPKLYATGDTPMGEGIRLALELVQGRKNEYKANGISYYRPWVLMVTDGAPTDEWKSAADAVRLAEDAKAVAFFAVGVEGANFAALKKIAVREPLRLMGLQFRDLFLWLSASQQSVSRSKPGDEVPLIDPTGPKGWASI